LGAKLATLDFKTGYFGLSYGCKTQNWLLQISKSATLDYLMGVKLATLDFKTDYCR